MTSTANTRLSRAAQSRRYADRGGDGFDDGSIDLVADAGDAGEGVVDGSIDVVADAGDAGAGVGDGHGVGGARTGAGTTFARRRLVGANTPWNRVRFAYVGGIKGTSFSRSSTPVSTRRARPSGSGRFIA
jgi:hypothetical protein